jgi:hypothetical protein
MDMPKIANDAASLIRVGTYTAELERLHLWGNDEDIDREFNAVCQTIWDFTLEISMTIVWLRQTMTGWTN